MTRAWQPARPCGASCARTPSTRSTSARTESASNRGGPAYAEGMRFWVAAVRALAASAVIVSVPALSAFRGEELMVNPAVVSGVDWRLESDRNASFRIDDEKLTGTDSCNRVFGDVVVGSEPVSIEFGVLGSTRMWCPDETGAQEDMRRALDGRRLVEQADDATLILVDEESGESWRFVT